MAWRRFEEGVGKPVFEHRLSGLSESIGGCFYATEVLRYDGLRCSEMSRIRNTRRS